MFKFLNQFMINRRREYKIARADPALKRLQNYGEPRGSRTYSIVTSVFDTDYRYLAQLSKSVIPQLSEICEWLILDNGSTKKHTLRWLSHIKKRDFVRVIRAEENLGIIGGMRLLLEQSRGIYYLPVDSDDILISDAIKIVDHFVSAFNEPELLYSDETKIDIHGIRDTYLKPDWDPIKFLDSCYIAHLCVINKRAAIDLGCYTDRSVEGCHDWDTFLRFYERGYLPKHIPEVLYAWRMHESSTSQNVNAKTYVFESQRVALNNYLQRRRMNFGQYKVEPSPFFDNTPDWWLKKIDEFRVRVDQIIILEEGEGLISDGSSQHELQISIGNESDLNSVFFCKEDKLGVLIADILERSQSTRDGPLVSIFRGIPMSIHPDRYIEATSIRTLFPSLIGVSGLVYDMDGIVVDGPRVFGYGQGFDCPDLGRPEADPGYFAELFKRRLINFPCLTNVCLFGDRLGSLHISSLRKASNCLEVLSILTQCDDVLSSNFAASRFMDIKVTDATRLHYNGLVSNSIVKYYETAINNPLFSFRRSLNFGEHITLQSKSDRDLEIAQKFGVNLEEARNEP